MESEAVPARAEWIPADGKRIPADVAYVGIMGTEVFVSDAMALA